MNFKKLLMTIIFCTLLCASAFATDKIDTSNLTVIYENNFDSEKALDDFTQYHGAWEIKNGRLCFTSKGNKDHSFILYTGKADLASLSDYVVDVDMYNIQSQGGVIARSDLSKIASDSNNGGNGFYGYLGFLSFTGEKGAIGYGSTEGKWGGNLFVSKNVTTPGANVHIQLAVKDNRITLNLYDIDRDRLIWSCTQENDLYNAGTFGFRLYSKNDKTFDGKALCNIGTTSFDNLVVSVYGKDATHVNAKTDTSEITFTNPVAPGADPHVFKDDDGTYYLYGTSGDAFGYRVYSSKNLVEWTSHGYCLHYAWEDVYDDPNQSSKEFWAPDVIKYSGKYYMSVSFQHHLNFAVSDSPTGPFKTIGPDILFPDIRTIDGHFFLDDDGQMYFYFVTGREATINGQSVQSGNNIWGAKLDMDALSRGEKKVIDEASVSLLVTNDADYESENIVEGPFMLKHDGKYYLTFSSGSASSPDYSVHYATSEKPLSGFKRDAKNVVLKCDDIYYNDIGNPHLYGTAHHSFVEAPNGKDLIIVYNSHRTNRTWAEPAPSSFRTPRSTCVDLAWFEGEYLLAGTKENKTVPTATAQPIFDGTTLTRETHFTGAFAPLKDLPCVYVAYTDGNDKNSGAKDSPVKTLSRAFELLKNGGTVYLTQQYTATSGNCLEIPALGGPLLITSEHSNVIFEFKYIVINSDTYFDNIIFTPVTLNEISLIECNFNNVVFGDGVNCINRPYGDYSFPYIVGGRWQYSGANSGSVYDKHFKHSDSRLISDKEYTISVFGGKWGGITHGSQNYLTPIDNSAPRGKLISTLQAEIKMTIGSKTAYVNGIPQTLDAPPVIKNDRTMLPVRFVAENLGAAVGWENATQTVSIKSDSVSIEIKIGADTANVNGKIIPLDSPAYIDASNNRTYLPVRVVAENLGATALWDAATQTVTLK